MTNLKCKICGGNIRITAEGCGLCENCGGELTLPKDCDDVRAELYNRANYFRSVKEFDRAYSEFEHMVADDRTDAEAYWMMMLCRYGVTYEQGADGRYELVVGNMHRESVFDDPDFAKAMEYCTLDAKNLYRLEAMRIEDVRKRYFEIVRTEKPYDVFLCIGDSAACRGIADTIYSKLREKGLRVFATGSAVFASRSEAEAQTAFALESAKLMFVISAGQGDISSPATAARWGAYLRLTQTDRSKKIIPVYSRVDVYDIPEAIPTHEAICADDEGWWQDLTRGTLQILGKLGVQAPAGGAVISAQAYIDEAKKAFDAGVWMTVELMAEEALNYEPENGYAHYYLFMGKNKAKTFDELLPRNVDWSRDGYLKRIIEYGEGELKDRAQSFLTEYINRTNYALAKKLMEKEEYAKALPVLEGLGGYRDSKRVLEECRALEYHQRKLAEYRKETDGKSVDYPVRKIRIEHQNIYDSYYAKIKAVMTAPRARKAPIIPFITMVTFLVGGVFALMYRHGDNDMKVNTMFFVFSLLPYFGCILYHGLHKEWNFMTFVMLGGAAYSNINTLVDKNGGIYYFITAVVPLLLFLVYLKREQRFDQLTEEMKKYNEERVKPLEKEIIDDLHARYGDVLTEDEIGTFVSVNFIATELAKREVQAQQGQ